MTNREQLDLLTDKDFADLTIGRTWNGSTVGVEQWLKDSEIIEKTADEMFKELDYYKLDTPEIAYRNETDFLIEIIFECNFKRYRIYAEDEDFTVSAPLHKAITKKMEELGWL